MPGSKFGFVKLLASLDPHCNYWVDEQHRPAGFESRLDPDLSLPFISTLIGLRAFDLVSSPVWWEAATNTFSPGLLAGLPSIRVGWGIKTNDRFEAERPPTSVGPPSGGRAAFQIPMHPLYSTRPYGLVQAIFWHTCPDLDLGLWYCLTHKTHIALSGSMTSRVRVSARSRPSPPL